MCNFHKLTAPWRSQHFHATRVMGKRGLGCYLWPGTFVSWRPWIFSLYILQLVDLFMYSIGWHGRFSAQSQKVQERNTAYDCRSASVSKDRIGPAMTRKSTTLDENNISVMLATLSRSRKFADFWEIHRWKKTFFPGCNRGKWSFLGSLSEP